eukprot:5132622-Amphidinium_carterae.1
MGNEPMQFELRHPTPLRVTSSVIRASLSKVLLGLSRTLQTPFDSLSETENGLRFFAGKCTLIKS